MARIYADLIKKEAINPTTGQKWTINDVPEDIREEVQRILDEG